MSDLNLQAPAAEEKLYHGTTYTIRWNSSSFTGQAKLALYQNYGAPATLIGYINNNVVIQSRNGTYNWDVGTYIGNRAPGGSNYLIRIFNMSGKLLGETRAFTIIAHEYCGNAVTFTKPLGGDALPSGCPYVVTWNYSGENVQTRLYLFKDNVWVGDIHNSVWCGNYDRSFNWTIGYYLGGTAPTGLGYTIRMARLDNGVYLGESGFFSIVDPVYHTITASAGAGGTITPSGAVGVCHGNSQIFTITPNMGYAVQAVYVDGVNKGAILSYPFNNVQTNHTISATFVATSATYTVTVDLVTGHGWILPGWTCCYKTYTVNAGSSFSVTLAPENGYYGWYYNLSGPGGGRFNFPSNGVITIPTVNENRNISVYFTN